MTGTSLLSAPPLFSSLLTPPFLPTLAQLRSVQEEMDSLEEEKESELGEVQEELRSAQEEVLVLQQAGEEAAAERENDIASLQEELCRLRAELQRLRTTAQEYELEITTLRAEINMKSMRREGETDGTAILYTALTLHLTQTTNHYNTTQAATLLKPLTQTQNTTIPHTHSLPNQYTTPYITLKQWNPISDEENPSQYTQ